MNNKRKFNNSKKSKFIKMTVNFGLLETDTFDPENVAEVLGKIPFELININLNMKKEDLYMPGKGYAQIGFVNKFYVKDDMYLCDLLVFDKFEDTISAYTNSETESLLVTTRAFINKETGEITKIIGLDLTVVAR